MPEERSVEQREVDDEMGKLRPEEFSGFVNTERKGTHQQEEGKQSETEMAKNACQVFDQMTLRGIWGTKKRKKKRWKTSLEIQEGLEKHLSSGEQEKTSPSCERISNEFGVSGKQGDVNKDVCKRQLFNRWLLCIFTEKKRRANWEQEKKGIKHNKYSHHWVYAKLFVVHATILKKLARWKKHRFKRKQKISVNGAGNHTVFSWEKKRATRKRKKKKFTKAKRSQTQEENNFRKQKNKGLMKRWKLVNGHVSYNHQVFEIVFMKRFTKKKKKRTRLEKHEGKVTKNGKDVQQLVFAKLSLRCKTVMKRLDEWKKRKQKHNKQKKKVRGSFSMDQLQGIVMPNRKQMVCKKFRSFKYKRRKLNQETPSRILKKNMFRGHKT